MSSVTSLILTMSCVEAEFDPELAGLGLSNLNRWFASRDKPQLSFLTPLMRVVKHPQSLTFGAGYNYFNVEEFTEYLSRVEWELPENVLLIVQPEDGPTTVWRPNFEPE